MQPPVGAKYAKSTAVPRTAREPGPPPTANGWRLGRGLVAFAPMRIIVNGEAQTGDEGLTVLALLERLGLAGQLVAVERNGHVIPRAKHGESELADGDRLEVVHFVGGG